MGKGWDSSPPPPAFDLAFDFKKLFGILAVASARKLPSILTSQ